MSKIENWNLDELFARLLSKYNLDLGSYAIASLERRLERFLMLHHFDDANALADKLVSDSVFFDTFIKEITVNTTEMFRDPLCWQVMRNEILDILRDLPTIRIWHAGCSSGEEVFSMAILLKEAGLYEKAKIVASDLNKDVIQAAINGVFSIKSMPLNEENYVKSGGLRSFSDYYTVRNSEAVMDPSLLSNVRFMKHDLSGGQVFSKFDIILCRNVMIYFNKELQENVFSLFNQSLFKRGFLVIGKKETMLYYTNYSLYSEFNSAEKIYRLI